MCKEFLILNSKEMNIAVKNWGKGHNNIYLIKEGIQMADKHVKRCSISYVMRDLQMKTVSYHYTPVRMAAAKTLTTARAGKDAEQQELSLIVKWYSHFGT